MATKVPSILFNNSPIFIVGEAPGGEEERQQRPFVGPSGHLLDQMLMEAGIARHSCSVSNVCKFRPPSNDIGAFFLDARRTKPNEQITQGIAELREEIVRVRPNVVIAAGETALWALTGLHKITNWRGSTLESTLVPGTKVIPIYHPAAILRVFEWRWITINDLRRAARESSTPDIPKPLYRFILEPTITQALDTLRDLHRRCEGGPTKLSCDIETARGHITCIGIAWSRSDAICIPFTQGPNDYWTFHEELEIILGLRQLLTHPNARIIGQNWLYDCQYIARHWGFVPWPAMDTMLAHHVCFAGLPKGLDFLASMYCEHYTQWKGEAKWEVKKDA
jgi:DNA polymerase